MSNKSPEKLIVKIVDATTGEVMLEHDDVSSIFTVMATEEGVHRFESVSATTKEYIIVVKKMLDVLSSVREEHPEVYFMAQLAHEKFPKE